MSEAHWSVAAIMVPMLILLFLGLGMPVALARGLVGIIAAYLFLGGLGIVGYVAWELSTSFVLGAIPLFIFMGQLLLHSGVSRRLYEGSSALLGRAKGGLLQTNIAACALFATISGSSVATAATIGAMGAAGNGEARLRPADEVERDGIASSDPPNQLHYPRREGNTAASLPESYSSNSLLALSLVHLRLAWFGIASWPPTCDI